MVSRIEVGFKTGVKDAHGESIKKRINEDLHIDAAVVRTIEVYTFEDDLPENDLSILGGRWETAHEGPWRAQVSPGTVHPYTSSLQQYLSNLGR